MSPREVTGGLSTTAKMPCASFSLPAAACGVGSRMREVGRAGVAGLPAGRRGAMVRASAELKLSPCTFCYAHKGNYTRPSVRNVLQTRLDLLMAAIDGGPVAQGRWIDAMVLLIAADGRPFFRWHDSGDLQSVTHLAMLCEVARRLPGVSFWLPTQERRILRDHGPVPSNLTVRLSAPIIDHALTGDVISSYVAAHVEPADDHHACPAPAQGGACGDCRACWDPEVRTVAYHVH